MAKVYTVSKAFQSKDKETGKPEVKNTPHGEFHKFMFQVEDQGKEGWMQMLKKPGNTLEVGDQIYGIIDEWDNGKAKWVKMQAPEGTELHQAPRANATADELASSTSSSKSQPSGSLEEKVDYLITLVEGFLESQGNRPAGAQKDSLPDDEDVDKPIDLSDIPY